MSFFGKALSMANAEPGADIPEDPANPAPAAAETGVGGDSVGAVLRRTRVGQDASLENVAETLKIRQSHLEAIEDGRHRDLPGQTYAVGFVRTYAAHLGLDGAEMARLYKAEISGIEEKTELVFPTPFKEGRFPGRAILLISVGLAVVVYGVWYYLSRGDDAAVSGAGAGPPPLIAMEKPTKAAAPKAAGEDEPAAATGTPAAATGTPAAAVAPTQDPPPQSPPPAEEPAGEAAAAESAAPPPPAAAPTPATPPAAEAESGTAAESQAAAAVEPEAASAAPARLIIRALSDSWLQIRDAADEVVTTRVLREGESYEVPDRTGLKLMTGNAGGLELVLDGRTLKPLGPAGAVRRDISLDPDVLLARQ